MSFAVKFLFISMLLFVSCTHPPVQPREEFAIIDNILIKTNQKLAREGFYERGSGGSYVPDIRSIIELYATNRYRFQSIDDTRLFFCKFFDDFVRPLNAEKRIRPLLHTYPLTPQIVSLRVSFVDDQREYLPPPYIASVAIIKGNICYFTMDSETDRLKIIHTESFERAQNIYKASIIAQGV